MSETNENTPAGKRIAVIAVHGVADQKRGDTGRALSELLVAQSSTAFSKVDDFRYSRISIAETILQVPLLVPEKNGTHLPPGFGKDLSQSASSDFYRRDWHSEGEAIARDELATGYSPGVKFTDYLLGKAQANGMLTSTYAMPVIRLQRDHKIGPVDEVDVFEMYWADLSRLSGSVPRVLTELFSLLFRLSALGRDTIDAAATLFQGANSWSYLQKLQTCLDWGYSRLLALLSLQLIMIGLILIPVALARDYVGPIFKVMAAFLGAGVFFYIAYRHEKWVLAVLFGGGITLLPIFNFGGSTKEYAIGIAWLVVLTIAYGWVLTIFEERFRFVRFVGWRLWILVSLITLACAFCSWDEGGMPLSHWVFGSLRAMEVVLMLAVVMWVVAGIGLLVWLVFCVRAILAVPKPDAKGSHMPRFIARSSVATGMLGLIISLGFFLVMSMSFWAAVETPLKLATQKYAYVPLIFIIDDAKKPACGIGCFLDAPHPETTTAANTGSCCPMLVKPAGTASLFVEDRFVNSTEELSLVGVLLLLIVAYLVASFAPSIVAELQLKRNMNGTYLGRWLTAGYRQLDGVVFWVSAIGVLAALLVGLLLGSARMVRWFNELQPFYNDWMMPISHCLSTWSQKLVNPLVYSAASLAVALGTLGGLLSKYVPALRAPLDVALDVDNHFREFPRRAIPRSRIFSRYFAVLRHIAALGYDRVVIVSHSQGTVISTELMRYVIERGSTQGAGDVAELHHFLKGKTRLLTAGCPLRQLYAARFPVMYEWVLASQGGQLGPQATDVGVSHWINLYTTGDYVGRWLWSGSPVAQDRSIPQIDRPVKYDDWLVARANLWTAITLQNEFDLCVGVGAHTHYFEPDQRAAAIAVDVLICMP